MCACRFLLLCVAGCLYHVYVLNVGLKLGAINATLFGIGVVMAVVTTLMTGPMLDRLGFAKKTLQTA